MKANRTPGIASRGVTTGCNAGFVINLAKANQITKDGISNVVIKPYMTGNDFMTNPNIKLTRMVIDVNHCKNIAELSKYRRVYIHLIKKLYPKVKNLNRVTVNNWWKFESARLRFKLAKEELIEYIVCPHTSSGHLFETVSSSITPDGSLQSFALDDSYSLGVLQSKLHVGWIKNMCTTLGEVYRYTSTKVFNTFPWPQAPTQRDIDAISKIVNELRLYRHDMMERNNYGLRKLYQFSKTTESNPLKDLHTELDLAVCKAYNFNVTKDLLAKLIDLNIYLAKQEVKGKTVLGPGLPSV